MLSVNIQFDKLALWGAEPGTLEANHLEVLLTLVDAYESKHHAIEAPDPIDAIVFRMEQQGLSRKDLEPLLGHRGREEVIQPPLRRWWETTPRATYPQPQPK
ncbi:MAG: HTH-type transcriptional regulator/antitoxin HigA [Myxococcota bacterium]|jgi:HTH-type transcriptional regulator/antitoxin HigA